MGTGGAQAAGSAGVGTGGTGVAACGASTGADKHIDDFEDGDSFIKVADGRTGGWHTYNDGTVGGVYSSTAPTALVGNGGGYGFCTNISGFKNWGANIVANMVEPPCGYDASPYTGVCFDVKLSVSGGGPAVFAVGTSDTVPAASGGACLTGCNAHYEHALMPTAAYQTVCYKWSEFKPPAGKPAPLDKAHIVQMEWKFPAYNKASTDGSICIDNIVFQ